MRKLIPAAALASLALAGCASSGIGNRNTPDEFAVARSAPLVIPPDYALVPPQPGQVSPVAADSRTQALQALFGGPSARSASERAVLQEAGRDASVAGVRSVAGDPNTTVVDKGETTRVIVAAPEGDGQEATVSTPQ